MRKFRIKESQTSLERRLIALLLTKKFQMSPKHRAILAEKRKELKELWHEIILFKDFS